MSALLNVGPAQIFPLTVDQYHAMIDNGILTSDDRVELLDGVLIRKLSINPYHCISVHASRQAFERVIPPGWYVADQRPITLESSEPEPDVAVIRGDFLDYRTGHPRAENVALVVEVSDSSLERDQVLKKRIYAAAGIISYWIIDVKKNRVEVYTEPQAGDYKRCDFFDRQQQIPVVLDGQTVGAVPVSDLLP